MCFLVWGWNYQPKAMCIVLPVKSQWHQVWEGSRLWWYKSGAACQGESRICCILVSGLHCNDDGIDGNGRVAILGLCRLRAAIPGLPSGKWAIAGPASKPLEKDWYGTTLPLWPSYWCWTSVNSRNSDIWFATSASIPLESPLMKHRHTFRWENQSNVCLSSIPSDVIWHNCANDKQWSLLKVYLQRMLLLFLWCHLTPADTQLLWATDFWWWKGKWGEENEEDIWTRWRWREIFVSSYALNITIILFLENLNVKFQLKHHWSHLPGR